MEITATTSQYNASQLQKLINDKVGRVICVVAAGSKAGELTIQVTNSIFASAVRRVLDEARISYK